MVVTDQLWGGFFSIKHHSNIYNDHHLEPHINIDQKNTYQHHTNIHTNSSKTQILSLSGSNNQGIMVNDAQVNMTNIFQRPIFLNLNQHSILFYLILVFIFFFIMIFIIIIGIFIYNRKAQQSKQKLYRQHRQSNNDQQQLKINHKKNTDLLGK